MYYCYSIKKGLFDNEMKYAKDIGVYIYYDEETDKFYDVENNEIDIKGLSIFPRTGAVQANKLVEAIIRHKGNCLVRKDDYNLTLDWPKFIETKRKNIVMTGKEILENSNKVINIFGQEKVFFKTKNKNYSGIINVNDLIDPELIIYKGLEYHQDEDFIISDVVNIIKDDFGPLEYRCFVVNNQILNISRVHDCLYHTIDEKIIFEIQNYIEQLQNTIFPNSYVIDMFEYVDKFGEKQLDVLEFNPIIASGTFLYNSVFLKQYDLSHSNPEQTIPKENIQYGPTEYYGYDVEGNTRASICYQLPGGFSADLFSLKMFGKKTSGTFLHIDTGGKNIDFSGKKPAKIEPIKSDNLTITENDFSTLYVKSENIDEVIKRLNKEYLEKNKKN